MCAGDTGGVGGTSGPTSGPTGGFGGFGSVSSVSPGGGGSRNERRLTLLNALQPSRPSPPPFVLPDVLPSFASPGVPLPSTFGTLPGFTLGAQGSPLQAAQGSAASGVPFTQASGDQSGRLILDAIGSLAARQNAVNLGF